MTETPPPVSIKEGDRVHVFRKGLQSTGKYGEVQRMGGWMALVLMEPDFEETVWFDAKDLRLA